MSQTHRYKKSKCMSRMMFNLNTTHSETQSPYFDKYCTLNRQELHAALIYLLGCLLQMCGYLQ